MRASAACATYLLGRDHHVDGQVVAAGKRSEIRYASNRLRARSRRDLTAGNGKEPICATWQVTMFTSSEKRRPR